ncbi:MAG TPA: rhomboid family intramembrane serine protease [Actinomycetota bacterium]|nr:rhomboid family intramembrane serine protease [Actinomycetota bacterium]
MGDTPRDAAGAVVDDSEQQFCYGHPKTPTKLRCSRCERPICGRCAIPASVGQHCPECVAEARRSAPKVRSVAMARSPAVVALLGLNVAFFVAQQLSPAVADRLMMSPFQVDLGEWWRLFTAMVLHAGPLHLAFNSLALWIFGPTLEEVFGTTRFVAIYVVSGLFASATSYAFGGGAASVGASGAIFGVIGALVVYVYRRRASATMSAYLGNLLWVVAINLLLGFTLPRIDNYAHIGGLVGGALLCLGMDRYGKNVPAAVQAGTLAAVAAAAVALVAVGDPLG